MKRVGIVTLITESPEARGVLDTVTETRRKTYCEEKSLSMSETYQARASGFSPSIRLVLPQEFEYRGETVCEYKGERYKIIRDYRDEKTGNATELTLERIRGNAAEPVPEPEPDPEEPTQGEPAATGETTESGPAEENTSSGADAPPSPQGEGLTSGEQTEGAEGGENP